MYLKINGKLQEITIETVSEAELIAYFEELCQRAKGNPWRGVEFAEASNVLKELIRSPRYEELQTSLAALQVFREAAVADPANKPQPRNFGDAMARYWKK